MTETVYDHDSGVGADGTASERSLESVQEGLYADDAARRAESTAVFSAVCSADPDRVGGYLSALAPALEDGQDRARANVALVFRHVAERDPVDRVRQAASRVLRTVTGTGTKVFRPETALSTE